MKKIHYNFEKKKVSMVVKKIAQSWYFFKMRVYYFFLPVSSRKKRLSVRLQKSTKTHLTDKKPKSKRKGRGKSFRFFSPNGSNNNSLFMPKRTKRTTWFFGRSSKFEHIFNRHEKAICFDLPGRKLNLDFCQQQKKKNQKELGSFISYLKVFAFLFFFSEACNLQFDRFEKGF